MYKDNFSKNIYKILIIFCLFIGHCDSHKIISSQSHEDILEENETIDDEFSTDEFSEDEFEQATYENILSTSETKSSTGDINKPLKNMIYY